MILYLAVSVCAVLAAALVYRYDLYDREPLMIIGLTALGGGLAMPWIGKWEAATLAAISTSWTGPAVFAGVGASHEELARFGAVWLLSRIDAFDDPIDGLVYGSMFGLGMGVEESFQVLGSVAGPAHLVLPVEMVRLLGHLIMGGITGFGFGLALTPLSRARWRTAGCLGVSMLLHFAWDWLALVFPRAGEMTPWQTLSAVSVIFFGMIFYGVLVVTGSHWSRRTLDPESRLGLWGWPFTVWFDEDD